jgi:hypothetical protein
MLDSSVDDIASPYINTYHEAVTLGQNSSTKLQTGSGYMRLESSKSAVVLWLLVRLHTSFADSAYHAIMNGQNNLKLKHR